MAFDAEAATDAPAHCVLEKIGEMPLEGGPLRPILVAQINGHPARLIVDTGSDATILFPQSMDRLGLQPLYLPSVKTYGIGGGSSAYSAYVKTFALGGLVAHGANLLVTGGKSGFDADGVIGAQFLLQVDTEFDLANKRVGFFRAKGCHGDQVVYWSQSYSMAALVTAPGNSLRVEARINDVPVKAELDTGSPRSTLIPALAERAGVKTTSDGTAQGHFIGGIGGHLVAASRGRFSRFVVGDETIRNADLEIADMFHDNTETVIGSKVPQRALDTADMLLGADFFRAHRIYVSQSQHKIYFTYVGGPVFETQDPDVKP